MLLANPTIRLATAVCVVSLVAAQTNTTASSTGNIVCATGLSVDLYGLGVRMGYYFNWVSGWIANNFVPSEIAGLQDTNSIFLLGVIASLLRGTVTGRLTRIDGLILLELAAGTIWSVLSLWGYRTCVYKVEKLHGMSNFGGFGTHFRLMLWTMVAAYGLWFFLIGVAPDGPHLRVASKPDACRTVWVLGLHLSGGVRIVGIVFCIISLVYCGVMLMCSSLAGITRTWKMSLLIRQQQYASSSRLRYIPGLDQQQLIRLWQALRVFNLFWIVFAMTAIEITLNQNHVRAVLLESDDDFLTPSQLLPLLIGLFSFIRTIYYAYEYLRDSDDIRPSLGLKPSARSGKPLPRPTGRRKILAWRIRYLSNSLYEPCATHQDEQSDDIVETVQQMSMARRVLMTWLPWLSVFNFWPWKTNARAKKIEGFETKSKEPSSGQEAK